MRLVLNKNYKYLASLDVASVMRVLQKFTSNKLMEVLHKLLPYIRHPMDLLEIFDELQNINRDKGHIVQVITAHEIDQNEYRKMRESILAKYPKATVINVHKPEIIGGCVIEIDGHKQIDASYRLELSNLIDRIKHRIERGIA